MAGTRSRLVTVGREEEVARRFKRIGEIIASTPGVSINANIGEIAGTNHTSWYGFVKKGSIGQKTIDKLVEFTGLAPGVFDGTASFGEDEETKIKEAVSKLSKSGSDNGESKTRRPRKSKAVDDGEKPIKIDGRTRAAKIGKAEKSENPEKSEKAEKVEKTVVIEAFVGAEDKLPASLLDSLVDVLKLIDAVDATMVNDVATIVDALRLKVDAKKAELNVLRAMRDKLSK